MKSTVCKYVNLSISVPLQNQITFRQAHYSRQQQQQQAMGPPKPTAGPHNDLIGKQGSLADFPAVFSQMNLGDTQSLNLAVSYI